MIRKILNFLRGYLLIEIKGNALERFINQINNKGIELWGIERIEKDFYKARIKINKFNSLRPLLRRRMCSVKILQKKGLPVIIYRIKRRYFILLGLIFFILLLYASSSFLWFISINGTENISEDKIFHVLNDSNVKPGILKKNIRLEDLEKLIIQEIEGIAWLHASWQGTKLNIEIVEKKTVEKSKKGFIIAARDGIITKLITLQGLAAVKEWDTVSEGQILIVPGTEDKGAKGIVKAYVWYEGIGEASLINKGYLFTGEEMNRWGFRIYNKELYFPYKKPGYKSYKIKRVINDLSKWRIIKIPIELIKEEYREIVFYEEDRSIETALFVARERAMDEVLNSLTPDALIIDIISSQVETNNKNTVSVRVLLKSEEDIAVLKEKSGGIEWQQLKD
jgi:similar to stage IV sporulation protein